MTTKKAPVISIHRQDGQPLPDAQFAQGMEILAVHATPPGTDKPVRLIGMTVITERKRRTYVIGVEDAIRLRDVLLQIISQAATAMVQDRQPPPVQETPK